METGNSGVEGAERKGRLVIQRGKWEWESYGRERETTVPERTFVDLVLDEIRLVERASVHLYKCFSCVSTTNKNLNIS